MNVMTSISVDVHAEIDEDTADSTHLEPLRSLIYNLPNDVLVMIDDDIIVIAL